MFKIVKKWFLPLALVMVAVLVLTGCSSTNHNCHNNSSSDNYCNHYCDATTTATNTILVGSFKVIGSNTITPLSAVWAENFMKANSKVSIAVSGPGSGAGIAALIDGTTDICQASRAIKPAEITRLRKKA